MGQVALPESLAGRPVAPGVPGREHPAVSADDVRRPCVLLGNLEPMALIGMSRLLADDGIDVVEQPGPAIVASAERLAPDAVVLGLDHEASHELGSRVRVAAPDAKVILWSRDESEMEVYDPGSSAPRRIPTAAPDALLSELKSRQTAREGD